MLRGNKSGVEPFMGAKKTGHDGSKEVEIVSSNNIDKRKGVCKLVQARRDDDVQCRAHSNAVSERRIGSVQNGAVVVSDLSR